MKSIFIFINICIFFIFFKSIYCQGAEPLTPKDILSVEKLPAYILSPDGKYVIIGVKLWNPDNGKSYSHLHIKI